MGSGCSKPKDLSPSFTKSLRRHLQQLCPPRGPSLHKTRTPTTTNIVNKISFSEMEGEEASGRSKGAKKGVSFVGVEEAPRPPPRARRRGSKGRRGAASPSLGAASPQGQLTPDSQDSDVEVVGNSRLPELLRRDTFCDALDFKLYTFGRFPGRRASSLEQLGAELGSTPGALSRSAEELSQPAELPPPTAPPVPPPPPPPQPTIQQSKQSFLNNILNETTAPHAVGRMETPAIVVSADDLTDSLAKLSAEEMTGKTGYTTVYSSTPPSREPSISESLQEFETSIYDMLKSKADSDDEPQPPPR